MVNYFSSIFLIVYIVHLYSIQHPDNHISHKVDCKQIDETRY